MCGTSRVNNVLSLDVEEKTTRDSGRHGGADLSWLQLASLRLP